MPLFRRLVRALVAVADPLDHRPRFMTAIDTMFARILLASLVSIGLSVRAHMQRTLSYTTCSTSGRRGLSLLPGRLETGLQSPFGALIIVPGA